MTRVAVIGSGTWGTAVASLLGGKGHEVSLWAHSPEVAERINAEHRNPKHLSDIELPHTSAISSLEDAVCGVDAIVMVVPSAYLRKTAQDMAPHVLERTPVVVLSKGVEAETGYTMLGVLRDVLGHKERLACRPQPRRGGLAPDVRGDGRRLVQRDLCGVLPGPVHGTDVSRLYLA